MSENDLRLSVPFAVDAAVSAPRSGSGGAVVAGAAVSAAAAAAVPS